MKHFKLVRTAALAAALGFVGLGAIDYATHIAPVVAQEETAPTESESSDDEVWTAYGAHWQVGDSWIVETKSSEHAVTSSRIGATLPVQWKFTVKDITTLKGVDYYRATVECVSKDVARAPKIVLLADVETGRLGAYKGEMKLNDGKTVKFHSECEGPVVMTPITALPIDLIAFDEIDFTPTKAVDGKIRVKRCIIRDRDFEDDSSYQKDVDGVEAEDNEDGLGGIISGYGFDPEVSVEVVDFSKTIDGKDYDGLRRATLSTATASVEQLWAPNVPWPVESDNGLFHSTLIKYEPKEN